MSESKALTPVRSADSVFNLNLSEPQPVEVSRDDVTRMLFETHKKCANAAEEVMAIKELAKINDLYPRANENITISHHVIHSLDRLQSMGDAELVKLIGEENLFDMPDPIEATYTEETDKEEEGVE